MRAPKWARYHVVGRREDGRKVSRYFKSTEKADALAKTLPFVNIALLFVIPLDAILADLARKSD